MGCAEEYDACPETLLTQSVWLVGLHYSGDLHLSVSHLAGDRDSKRSAQDAAYILPGELPASELCRFNSR